MELQYQVHPNEHFLHLPLLENPKLLQPPHGSTIRCNSMGAYGIDMNNNASTLQSSSLTQEEHISAMYGNGGASEAVDQVTDWRVLDKFVASQLSQEDDVC